MIATRVRSILALAGACQIAATLFLIRTHRETVWQRPLLSLGLLCLVPYFFEQRRVRDLVVFAVPLVLIYALSTRDWLGLVFLSTGLATLYVAAKKERETQAPALWKVFRQVVLILGLTALAIVLGAVAFRGMTWTFEGLLGR